LKKTHPLMLFLKIFKSIRLALILIGYLVVTSIVATLIPQGKKISFYAQYFSYPVYRIIIGLNIDNFFRSLLFIIPLSIFTINLAVCTVTRIINRFRSKLPLRLGADIIHVGLLLLIFAGVITLFARKEGFVFLAPGDVVSLPNGYELKLKSFAFQIKQLPFLPGLNLVN